MIEPVPVAVLLAIVAFCVAVRLSAERARFVRLGALWFIYAGYECLMYFRVFCTGECNIRVDLLLIYPVLLGVTLWYIGAALSRRSNGHGTLSGA